MFTFYHIPFSDFYLNRSLNPLFVLQQNDQRLLQFAFTVKLKPGLHYGNVCGLFSPHTLQLLTTVCHCAQTLHSIISLASVSNTHAD